MELYYNTGDRRWSRRSADVQADERKLLDAIIWRQPSPPGVDDGCERACHQDHKKTPQLAVSVEGALGTNRGVTLTWWDLLYPPTWRPAPHAARPSSAAAGPALHSNLPPGKTRNQTLSVQTWVYVQVSFYLLWICECKSLVITWSCPRLMSLMSPCLRFLFIKPSLMWGRWGSCIKTHTELKTRLQCVWNCISNQMFLLLLIYKNNYLWVIWQHVMHSPIV